MSTFYYPAVFHIAEDIGGYWVEFPDLPGCFSQGEHIEDTMEHAKEALGLYLDTSDDIYERTTLNPSSIEKVMEQFPKQIVVLVEYDDVKYARMYKNKAIKKTLSIPEWLNDEATKQGVNFSQVLQEALLAKLNLL